MKDSSEWVIAALKELGVIEREIPRDKAFIGAMSLDGTVEKAEVMLPVHMLKIHSISNI